MKIEKDTLTRYFLQQVSEEEKVTIKNWLDENQEHKKEFVEQRIHFDASLLVDENQIISKKPIQRYINFKPYLNIAASIIFAMISIYFYDSYKTDKLSKQLQTITTPLSCRTQVTLPDGTQVWLNANSTLVYSTIFSDDERKVSLNGEAYFDVIKSDAPFIVSTNKCDIEVLGTSFNVNAYDNSFLTSLFSGEVKVISKDVNIDAVYLSPGQTAELIDGQIIVTHSVDVNSMRWKDGLIVLDGKSFEEIIELLEKYYDMSITIKNDDVKSLGYVGSIRITDGIEHVFRVLETGQSFSYEIDKQSREITIY